MSSKKEKKNVAPVFVGQEAGLLQPVCSVEIERNSRGYNWKIKVYNNDLGEAISTIEVCDNRMKKLYGNGEPVTTMIR